MSVWRTSYLLYGYTFEEKKDIDVFIEHYEELMEDKPWSEMFNNDDSDQTFVYDYMGGNYVYIGIVLAKINEDEDDVYAEIDNEDIFISLKKELKEYEEKWPDYIKNIVKDIEPKLYFFIHAH